jgi:hypothetical protein
MIKIFTLPDQDSAPEVAQLFDAEGHVGTSYALNAPTGERLRDAQELAKGALAQWQEKHGKQPGGPNDMALALREHSAAVLGAHAAKRIFGKTPVFDSEMAEKFAARGILLAYVSLVSLGLQATRRGEWLGGGIRMPGIENRRADLVREVAEHWIENETHKLADPNLRDGVLADSFAAHLAILEMELPVSATASLPAPVEAAIPFNITEQALLVQWWAKHGSALALTEAESPLDLRFDTNQAASVTCTARALHLRDALHALRDVTARIRRNDPAAELTDVLGYGSHYKMGLHLAVDLMPVDFASTCERSPAVARAVYLLSQRAVIGAQPPEGRGSAKK